VAFNPDGKAVLTGSEDNTARLWNAADGAPIGKPMVQQGAGPGRRLQPRRKKPYSPAATTRPRGSGTPPTALPSASPWCTRARVPAAAFSPDGKTILTGSRDNAARLWNAADGAPIGKPMVHQGTVWAVAFSPDGKAVLTGSEDNAARLWNAADGAPVGKPMVHQGAVLAAAFSPDGKPYSPAAATTRRGSGTPADGAPVGKPMVHQGQILAVAFSPDGKTILTGSWDKRGPALERRRRRSPSASPWCTRTRSWPPPSAPTARPSSPAAATTRRGSGNAADGAPVGSP